MSGNILQFTGSDGCIYVLDIDKKKKFRVCELGVFPPDVQKQVLKYLADAEDTAHAAGVVKELL